MAEAQQSEMGTRLVALDWIKIPEGRRRVDAGAVERLLESITSVGLLEAVAARPDGTLIFGAHRVESFKRLGRTEIPCVVMDFSDLDAELAEIDENLLRMPLSPLEEAVKTARRKEIYEARYPETKHGGDRKSETYQKSSPQNEDLIERAPSFVDDTAAKTGKSAKTIERNVRIGKAFVADELEKLQAANVPILEIDKLASLRRRPEYRAQVEAVFAAPVATMRAAIESLAAIKETNRTSAGRRQKILTDLERRAESLARQTPEQRRARLEAGELFEVDRLVERIERLTFRSALEKIVAATCARMALLEDHGNAAIGSNSGRGVDPGVGAALAERSEV